MERQHKLFEAHIRASASGAEPHTLDFIVSTDALDRYDEIIEPSGWDLESYRKNPVFLNSHRSGDLANVLGTALLTEVREVDGKRVLFQRVRFAVDVNPAARLAYDLYRFGFLRAVSVGFIPVKWEEGNAQAGFSRRYLQQELVEVSAVAIGANPEALVQLTASGNPRLSDLASRLAAAMSAR